MRAGAAVLFFILSIAIVISTVEQSVATKGHDFCERTLPLNIVLPNDLERMLAGFYRASATFRAQCDRIGASETLQVIMRLDLAIPRSCQAFTIFGRQGRLLRAEVHIPPAGTRLAELVGHEFEHIVEQLDGLDMRSLSLIRRSGVYESGDNIFESIRAQKAGHIIAREVLSGD